MSYIHSINGVDIERVGCVHVKNMRHTAFRYLCQDAVPHGSGTILDNRFDDYKYYGHALSVPVTPDYGWNAETNIYTDVAGTTTATSDGDKIAAWGSFGNNKILFTQSTENQRPVLKKGVFGANSKDSLLFTATNLQFVWNDSKVFNSTTGAIFAVIKYSSSSNNQYLLGMRGHIDDLAYFGVGTSNTDNFQYFLQRDDFADGSSTALKGNVALNTNKSIILGYIQDGSGQDYYLNGSLSTITTGTPDTNWTLQTVATRSSIGALYGASVSAYYNGYLAELLVYESTLTVNQITDINNYLITKYGTI